VVFRFLTGQDAPVAVLATALYQQIPPDKSDGSPHAGVSGEGRKFLSFADSRQDAAFFAPYLQRTYDRIMRRRLIVQTLRSCEPSSVLRLQDLVPRVRQQAEAAGVFTQSQSSDERQRVVWTWLLQELTAWDRQNSLEGLGLVQFRLVRPQGWQPPAELLQDPWRLSADEAWTLICLLMDSVRQQGAITFPDGVSPTDEAFAPRTRALFLRGSGPDRGAGILAWRPQSGANRRSDLLLRLAERYAPTADSRPQRERTEALLTAVWDHISAPGGPWRDHVVKETHKQHGVLFRLSHKFWEVVPAPAHAPDGWHRCNTCRTLTPLNLRNLCPRYRCAGTLEPRRPDREEWEGNHYRYLYETLAPVPLRVVEHTAQWTSEEAAAIQDRFVRGEVNALSCSTTFELGVDVGELQAVLMRNVPPTTANYVQRAGRAGRRTDAAAFALTYAQRCSHDLTHYADPVALVAGRITPPVVRLENEPIIRRHMHAVLFAAFLREERDKHGREYGQVGAFFADGEEGDRGADRLRRYADDRPRAVQEALQRIVPPELPETLRPDSWGWLMELYQEPEGGAGGLLGRVCDEVRTDLAIVNQLAQEAYSRQRGHEGDRYRQIANTLRRRELLGFLSTRGLLPKYGFPVDVVELRTAHADVDVGRKLELERDLRLAIGDYAPGGEVVAGGYLWRSRGLHVIPGRSWPEYKYAYCRACGWFDRDIEEGAIPGGCAVCGTTVHTRGTFLVPLFGFVADRKPGSPGEARPQRSYASRVYFSRYDPPAGTGEPEFEPVDGLSARGGITVTQRYARYGRLAVINAGPEARGFRICRQCGYADVPPGATGKKGTTQHTSPWMGKACKGTLTSCHLGHEFLTDTLELRLDGPGIHGYDNDTGAWRSVLYALLEGAARALGIARADLDGTLRRYAMDAAPALVLFDDVPGGAGYCRRIKESLPAVFRKAREVVEQCACGEETSCYQCLRNYRNQPYHHELRRNSVRGILNTWADG
jgi:hypothetical protein